MAAGAWHNWSHGICSQTQREMDAGSQLLFSGPWHVGWGCPQWSGLPVSVNVVQMRPIKWTVKVRSYTEGAYFVGYDC